MRIPLLAFACLIVALPAPAAEVIRYRTPDGSIGFVDDEKRLPPGVEVLSRTPLEPSAPKPPPPLPPAAAELPASGVAGEPPASDVAGAPGAAPDAAAASDPDEACETLENLLERTRCRSAREARCSHYGLSPGCKAQEIAAAEDWCARGAALREEIAGVDQERDAARERHEECLRDRGLLRPDCASEALEEAEHAARTGERRVEALEEQCHEEGCLPGWVREGCGYEPEA
jgi:hypothetical protein